jgi:ribosome-associated protein
MRRQARFFSSVSARYDGDTMIEIAPGLAIPEAELTFAASRSGGPGGQNVNKVATKVTLTFDVSSSPSLTDEQRSRVRARLATRISKDGVLQVVSQRHRTQGANRAAALERFVELLRDALAVEVARVPTRPSRAAKERRVAEKELHARTKQTRRRVVTEE